jgi:hypothetical protein
MVAKFDGNGGRLLASPKLDVDLRLEKSQNIHKTQSAMISKHNRQRHLPEE